MERARDALRPHRSRLRPEAPNRGEPRVSAEASELVSIPRIELDAMKAELKRLRREVGRGVAKARIQADPGPARTRPRSHASSSPRPGE
jgi:hypothetical protein